MDTSCLDAIEYISVQEDGPVRDREQSWIAGGDDEESEEDFEWMEGLTSDQKDNETYFTFINEMRKTMKAGSQAWNCYGNRSNLFLMVNYGFCF